MEYKPVLAKNQIHSPEEYKSTFPVIVMPKLDGFRCGITLPKPPNVDYKEGKYDVPDTVVGWSRNKKNIRSLYVQYILQKFYEVNGPGWDGELIAGDNFQEAAVVTQKGSKDEPIDFTFVIFDYVPGYNTKFTDRLDKCYDAIGNFIVEYPEYAKHFSLVTFKLVIDLKGLLTAYNELKTPEGCMLRVIHNDLDNGYHEDKRDPNLIKVKPFQQSEAIIIGFEEEKYGKNLKTVPEHLWGTTKGRAGKLKVHGLANTPFSDKEWNIGSGLTHEQRQDIYDNFEENWNNKIITFKYLESGTKNKPRHPVFLGFREDLYA